MAAMSPAGWRRCSDSQPAEVTLRRGWPLDLPLTIARDGGAVQARDAEGNVVAEAREATLDLDPPAAADA